jgi:hypothetical protein
VSLLHSPVVRGVAGIALIGQYGQENSDLKWAFARVTFGVE